MATESPSGMVERCEFSWPQNGASGRNVSEQVVLAIQLACLSLFFFILFFIYHT
jgi:hypothetical protein